MNDNDDRRRAPHQPSEAWRIVWIAITAIGVASWVLLAALSYYERGNPISFGDNTLIGFLTLTPTLGVIAWGTWVIRNAQSRIADHAQREAERRHAEQLKIQEAQHQQTLEAIEQAKRHVMQQMWKAIAGEARKIFDNEDVAAGGNSGVVPMRRQSRGS